MQKLIVVYNPRSTRFAAVEREVLAPARNLQGWAVGKYVVEPLPLGDNAERLAKILSDGDLVIAAGGDGTSAMALNAILLSQKQVAMGIAGHGNFNDLAGTFGNLQFGEIIKNFEQQKMQEVYPLEIQVDGEHWRYVLAYATLGMAAEVTRIFDQGNARKKQNWLTRQKIYSYLAMAKWYYENRKKVFVPSVKINGEEYAKLTDIIVMNGPRMAKVMRGKRWYLGKEDFGVGAFYLRHSLPLFSFMLKSMFAKVPVKAQKSAKIEFAEPASVEIQAEGEYQKLENIKQIDIKKAGKIRVVYK